MGWIPFYWHEMSLKLWWKIHCVRPTQIQVYLCPVLLSLAEEQGAGGRAGGSEPHDKDMDSAINMVKLLLSLPF